MNESESGKKKKTKKPGQWSPLDIVLLIFGIAVLAALAVAGFRVAKWLMATFL